MEEYSPPIKERENEELLDIFTAPKGGWQDDAVKQATDELIRRGYTFDELRNISDDYKRFLEDEERKYQAELAQNATESYSILKMVFIFFAAPLIFFPHFNSFGDMTVSELKRENYKIKFRQRLFLLIGGAIFYLILFRLAFIIHY